jgi:hypothetical protein
MIQPGDGHGLVWAKAVLDGYAQQPTDYIATTTKAHRFNYGSIAYSTDFNSHDARRLTVSCTASVRPASDPQTWLWSM